MESMKRMRSEDEFGLGDINEAGEDYGFLEMVEMELIDTAWFDICIWYNMNNK